MGKDDEADHGDRVADEKAGEFALGFYSEVHFSGSLFGFGVEAYQLLVCAIATDMPTHTEVLEKVISS